MVMAGSEELEESFPSEIQGRLTEFDEAITGVEEILKPLHSVPLSQVQAKLSALDKAKLDLLGAYAVNSLFWMYLNTRGENPKEHGVKEELDRIRRYMSRVKEIQDKEKAPKLNKPASKRFVRSALWHQAHKQAGQHKEHEAVTTAVTETASSSSSISQLHPSTSGQSQSPAQVQSKRQHEGRPRHHKKRKKSNM